MTDGTPGGTVQLADLAPGPTNSNPGAFVAMDGYAVFPARISKPVTGLVTRALLWTDGRPEGTRLLTTRPLIYGDPFDQHSGRLGELLLFQAYTANSGHELWITDGFVAGTRELIDLAPGAAGSSPAEFVRLGDRLLFRAEVDDGVELFVTDGTAAGTQQVADLSPGSSSPTGLTALNDFVLFSAHSGDHGRELWRSDGTSAGTWLVADLTPGSSDPRYLTRIGDRVLFTTSSPSPGAGIWWTDGTPEGTVELPVPVQPGFSPPPTNGAVVPLGDRGGAVVLGRSPSMGLELWLVSGDGGPPQLLPEVVPGPQDSEPLDPVEHRGRLLFVAEDPLVGYELFAFNLLDLGLGSAVVLGQGCSNGEFEPVIDWVGSGGLGQTLELRVADAAPASPAFALCSTEFAFTQLPTNCLTYLAAPKLLGMTDTDAHGRGSIDLGIPNAQELLGSRFVLQWVSAEPAGPRLGAFAASSALDLRLGP